MVKLSSKEKHFIKLFLVCFFGFLKQTQQLMSRKFVKQSLMCTKDQIRNFFFLTTQPYCSIKCSEAIVCLKRKYLKLSPRKQFEALKETNDVQSLKRKKRKNSVSLYTIIKNYVPNYFSHKYAKDGFLKVSRFILRKNNFFIDICFKCI